MDSARDPRSRAAPGELPVLAEETLRAVRRGEIDAFVIETGAGPRVFTLNPADSAYRAILDGLPIGVAAISPDDQLILYANSRFVGLVRTGEAPVVGASVRELFAPESAPTLMRLLTDEGRSRREATLRTGGSLPATLNCMAVNIQIHAVSAVCLLVTERDRGSPRNRFAAA